GDTTKRHRETVITAFYKHIENAKEIYCLDADLSMLTIETIDAVKGNSAYGYTALVNSFKRERDITLYQIKGDMFDALYDDINNGKRVFITSNSRRGVSKLHSDIGDHCPGATCLLITYDTHDTEAAQDFIANPDEQFQKYQVVLASPTLSTGID